MPNSVLSQLFARQLAQDLGTNTSNDVGARHSTDSSLPFTHLLNFRSALYPVSFQRASKHSTSPQLNRPRRCTSGYHAAEIGTRSDQLRPRSISSGPAAGLYARQNTASLKTRRFKGEHWRVAKIKWSRPGLTNRSMTPSISSFRA
jgi:hypothetical protein